VPCDFLIVQLVAILAHVHEVTILEKLQPSSLRDDQTIEPRITDAHRALIGELIETWTSVDSNLEMMIWEFLRIDELDGRIVTSKMDARNKLQMLRALVNRHLTLPEHLEKAKRTINEIDQLRDERNFVAHGNWGTLMPEGVPIAASLRKKSDIEEVVSETFPESRMRAIIAGNEASLNAIRQIGAMLLTLRETKK
jgi:hypothetical protein